MKSETEIRHIIEATSLVIKSFSLNMYIPLPNKFQARHLSIIPEDASSKQIDPHSPLPCTFAHSLACRQYQTMALASRSRQHPSEHK